MRRGLLPASRYFDSSSRKPGSGWRISASSSARASSRLHGSLLLAGLASLSRGGGAAIGDRGDVLLFEEDVDDVAGHLIGRVPARPDRDVERAGIDNVV